MKRFATRLLIFALLLFIVTDLQAAEIWVAPNGNDSNAGTKDSPLLTPAAALRKAREMRRLKDATIKDGIQIILKGGEYQLEEPLFVRPEDSGTAESPTVIESAAGEQVALSGGIKVDGWKKLQRTVAGLPGAALGKVWVTDIPQIAGVPMLFRQLWINGKKAVRARESDSDEQMSRIISVDKQKQEMTIPMPATGLPANAHQMEMVIHQMWAIANLRVKSIKKQGNTAVLTFYQPESRVEFEHPWPAAVIDKDHKMNGNSAFYLTNAIEFLNRPGEWYADQQSGKLYYWPRAGKNLSTTKVIVPSLETLVKVEGTLERPVSYVSFKGISFEYSTWLRPSLQGHVPHQAGMYMLDAYKLKIKGTPEKAGLENQAWLGRPVSAVEVKYTNHVDFEGCKFTHLASTGVDYVRGTHDDQVKGNLFKDIGGTGIQIGTFSDEAFETHIPYNPADLKEVCTNEHISNNLVTDVTNEDWGCVGIGAGYVKGIHIEHNEVCEVGYSGISMGWGWTKLANCMSDNLIRANKVHHYAKHMYDVAGIYTLSAQPNSLITENYVDSIYKVSYAHDLHHWFYLYCDEGSSYFTVKNNWCPAEKFLKNANGPGDVWENNGPMVSEEIKRSAGLEPAYRYLLKNIEINPDHQPINHAENLTERK